MKTPGQYSPGGAQGEAGRTALGAVGGDLGVHQLTAGNGPQCRADALRGSGLEPEVTAFSQEEEEERGNPMGTEEGQPRQETSQETPLPWKLGPHVMETKYRCQRRAGRGMSAGCGKRGP